jgi:hypothetical protein
MSVLAVYTYTVKAERYNDQFAFIEKVKDFAKRRPELFKGVKSYRFFSKLAGGKFGDFVEMLEYENLAEFEKGYVEGMQDKEYLETIYPDIVALTIPGTFGLELWNSAP